METIPGKDNVLYLNEKLTDKLYKMHRKQEFWEQTRKKEGRTVCLGAALWGEKRYVGCITP